MLNSNAAKIEITTSTILKTVFIVLGLALFYVVRDIVLLLLVAVTFASALEPLVATAHKTLKFPRTLTVLLVYVIVLGLLGLFFYTLTPLFIEQFSQLGIKYKEFVQNVNNSDGQFYEFLRSMGLGNSLSNLFDSFSNASANTLGRAVNFLTGFLEIIAVLVISFYLVVEQTAMRATVKQLLPEEHREKAVRVITAIQRKLGMWLLGQIILSLTIFLVTFTILSLLNINLALALAAVAGLLEIVPFLGPIMAAIPAILIAFTQSPALAFVVGIMYLLVQKTENYILVPKIMEKTVGLHPLVILFSVLIGFKLAGMFGAVLAVPVVAAASVIVEAYIYGKQPHVPEKPESILLK